MSITVYGCVNTDGSITFENLEACLVQEACRVTSGEHAGQVALTLSEADDEDCNDTFYGCYNNTTGKFQVVIPENCCMIPAECQWCEEYQPLALTVVLSAFNNIDCCWYPPAARACKDFGVASTVNGSYVLNWRGPGDPCRYLKNFTKDCGHTYLYSEEDCTGELEFDIDWVHLQIRAVLREDDILIQAYLDDQVRFNPLIFKGTISYGEGESCGEASGSASNILEGCVTGDGLSWRPCEGSGQASVLT